MGHSWGISGCISERAELHREPLQSVLHCSYSVPGQSDLGIDSAREGHQFFVERGCVGFLRGCWMESQWAN